MNLARRRQTDTVRCLVQLPYYVNMAIAWLLATALYHFPEKTRQFAGSGILPDVVLKFYVRKARESFRTRTVVPV